MANPYAGAGGFSASGPISAGGVRNFQLNPNQGGPVMRRPGNGLLGQFNKDDAIAALQYQFPGSSYADLASTALAQINKAQGMRGLGFAAEGVDAGTGNMLFRGSASGFGGGRNSGGYSGGGAAHGRTGRIAGRDVEEDLEMRQRRLAYGSPQYGSSHGHSRYTQSFRIPQMRRGGRVWTSNPYIVNEDGVEAYKPAGERDPFLMLPSEEHIRIFEEDGVVIPHEKTMELLKKGEIAMPEHRARGGPVRGAIAKNIQVYKTGGYGAQEASPGRIGYRGRLKDPSSGLDDFYLKRAIDPITGISMKPSGWQMAQQRARMQGAFGGFGAGAPTGRDAQGNLTYEGGRGADPEGLALLDAYNQFRDSGNPYMQAYVGSMMQGLKGARLAGQQGAVPQSTAARGTAPVPTAYGKITPPKGFSVSAQAFKVADKLGQAEATPISISQAHPIGSQEVLSSAKSMQEAMAQQEEMMKAVRAAAGRRSGIPARQHGGDVRKLNPYLVGEDGPETFVPFGAMPEPIGLGGPEVRTFLRDGVVLPNPGTMMTSSGTVVPSNPYEQALPQPIPSDEGMPPDLAQKVFAAMASQKAAMAKPYIGSKGYLASFAQPKSQDLEAIYGLLDYGKLPDALTMMNVQRGASYGAPAQADPAFDADAFYAAMDPYGPPISVAPQESSAINPYLSGLRSMAAQNAPAINAVHQTAKEIAGVRDRMTGVGGERQPVMALSGPGDLKQVFQTPYGTASVNFGAKEPTSFEGLPAGAWFQRAANRQGEPNKFAAKLDPGYKTAKEKYAIEQKNLRKAAKA